MKKYKVISLALLSIPFLPGSLAATEVNKSAAEAIAFLRLGLPPERNPIPREDKSNYGHCFTISRDSNLNVDTGGYKPYSLCASVDECILSINQYKSDYIHTVQISLNDIFINSIKAIKLTDYANQNNIGNMRIIDTENNGYAFNALFMANPQSIGISINSDKESICSKKGDGTAVCRSSYLFHLADQSNYVRAQKAVESIFHVSKCGKKAAF